MNLENEMYRVMAAFCSGGIPVDFKGAMVLHAFLYENGFTETAIRPTRDIDANWLSDVPPSMDFIVRSFQNVLDQNNIPLVAKPFREYGVDRSAGIDFCGKATGNTVFTMDMEVNRLEIGTRYYSVGNFQFRGVVVEQILADKISVISSGKIFQRIKDILDLYYLSQCFRMDSQQIKKVLRQTNRPLQSFDEFRNNTAELEHAYNKFRFTGNVEKPSFHIVYAEVTEYISDFLPKKP